MATKIVTDSTAYLPQEMLTQYDIRVVPLKVLFGRQVYKDGIDLGNDEFYQMLAETPQLPTTSQPSAGEFENVYSELVAQGHEIVSVHISGKLSGTVESARAAAKQFPDARIHIIDSLSAAFGLALMVIESAKAAFEGDDSSRIVYRLEQMVRDVTMLFVVDALEYLERGGRIGAARAMLGTLLKVKPILKLEDGLIVPVSSVRTKRKAVALMLDQAVEAAGGRCVHLAVAHGQAPEEMEELLGTARDRLDCSDIFISEVGPVIGTHTGPGVLGVAVCPIENGL